jgi:hypothetical protein
MATKNKFGALRIKEDTLDFLRDLKEAFEITYGQTLTNDDFVKKMAASVEDGDVAVWEMYCLRQQQKEEATKKVQELKEKK